MTTVGKGRELGRLIGKHPCRLQRSKAVRRGARLYTVESSDGIWFGGFQTLKRDESRTNQERTRLPGKHDTVHSTRLTHPLLAS